jgi:hypothetical protein
MIQERVRRGLQDSCGREASLQEACEHSGGRVEHAEIRILNATATSRQRLARLWLSLISILRPLAEASGVSPKKLRLVIYFSYFFLYFFPLSYLLHPYSRFRLVR